MCAAIIALGCGNGSSSAPDGGGGDLDGALPLADADPGADGRPAGVLLFGGDSGNDLLGDTWSWDGQVWGGELVAGQPDARRDHALAYDVARERVVLFGGFDGATQIGDTWTWDGQAWERHEPAAEDAPTARADHALAYDSTRGGAVLFGGSRIEAGAGEELFDDTWLWDGSDWQLEALGDEPPARAGHAMAFDAASAELVLFGGDGGDELLDDTWVLGEASWNDVSPAGGESPAGRRDHALAYDPIRETALLFGGADDDSVLGDTWEWDGTAQTWTEVGDPASGPAARADHALTFDPSRDRIILFGGTDGDGQPLSETWAWNGSGWEEIAAGDEAGPARAGHALSRSPEGAPR